MKNKNLASKIPAVIIGIMSAVLLMLVIVIVVELASGYKQKTYCSVADFVSRMAHGKYANVASDINRHYFLDLDGSEEMNNMKAVSDYYNSTLLYYAYENEPESKIYKDAVELREESSKNMGQFDYVASKIDEEVKERYLKSVGN